MAMVFVVVYFIIIIFRILGRTKKLMENYGMERGKKNSDHLLLFPQCIPHQLSQMLLNETYSSRKQSSIFEAERVQKLFI